MSAAKSPVPSMTASVLCVGVSDSGAGTGLQADIKTAQAFGVYATCAVTAVAAQNTCEIAALYCLPPEIVGSQIEAVVTDMPPAVIKTGMLAGTPAIRAIGDFFDRIGPRPDRPKIVFDPVMTGRGGMMLLDKEGRDILRRSLLLHADILTPNVREASELTGLAIGDVEDMRRAAEMLRTLGPQAVVLKGGGLATADGMIYDVLADEAGTIVKTFRRHDTRHTHGAGTTLAAALACGLARGANLRTAYADARAYLDRAIAWAPGLGAGNGPVNHAGSIFRGQDDAAIC